MTSDIRLFLLLQVDAVFKNQSKDQVLEFPGSQDVVESGWSLELDASGLELHWDVSSDAVQ